LISSRPPIVSGDKIQSSTATGSRGYRRLQVFQKAQELSNEIIRITEYYPKKEVFGAVSQSRRAAISIVSNIAEGYRKCSRNEFARFLKIAYGSCGELDAQLMVAHKAGWINYADYERIEEMLDTVSRWTWRLMDSLSRPR
jgi:four helix bundle protein